MILTVTLNASVDKAYHMAEGIQDGSVMRVASCRNSAGGKGLNVARIVRLCGAEVAATGFTGGHNGAYLEELLTADGIVRYVRSMYNAEPEAMLALYRLADGMVEAMEFNATAHTHNLGRTLREITLKPNILIACIVREGEVIIPRGDDRLLEDDSVFVVAPAQRKIAELNDIFAPAEEHTV